MNFTYPIGELIWHIVDHGVVILHGIEDPINTNEALIIGENMLEEGLNPKLYVIGVEIKILIGRIGKSLSV